MMSLTPESAISLKYYGTVRNTDFERGNEEVTYTLELFLFTAGKVQQIFRLFEQNSTLSLSLGDIQTTSIYCYLSLGSILHNT